MHGLPQPPIPRPRPLAHMPASPPSSPTPSAAADAAALARTAGLRDLRVPRLEEVDRRRSQLWALSLLVALALPVVMLAIGTEGLATMFEPVVDVRTARLVLLAMLVVMMGYVAEREVTLRRLTGLLVEERVLTASLVNRVDELNLLVRATRAMNSALDLQHVLAQIAESAHDLLRAGGVTLHLLEDHEGHRQLRVAATYGASGDVVGTRQSLDEGLAGRAATVRDALLQTDGGEGSRRTGPTGEAIAVPLELRGELVGVLTVRGGDDREAYTEFDLRSVSVFANTAAAAISNARAYEEQLGQVATLLEADQAKDEFLTLVTHELRTPLTSMIGLLTTMSTRANALTPDQVREFAAIAKTQGWRLDRLIGDLLDSSKAQRRALELSLQTTSVAEVLQRAVAAIAHSLPEREITCEVPAHLVVSLDPEVLLRITDNLLSNAVKYTPADSPIDVRVTSEPRGLRLDVIDHGPGVAPEDVEALFGKFVRGADPFDRGGLGLGLYVVRALAEAHAGRVDVSPTPGGGATFSVWLGVAPADVHRVAAT